MLARCGLVQETITTHRNTVTTTNEMTTPMDANTRQFEAELAAQHDASSEQVELHAEATVTAATTL